MYQDNGLTFSSAQAITATAASTSIVDLTGFGSTFAPNLTFGGTVYGADMGVGDGMAVPKIACFVGTTFLTLTSLTVSAQFAVDNGSNSPGTYQTYAETGAIPVAALTAGANIGTFDLPKAPEGDLAQYPLPRFMRLEYTVAGSNATAGTVNAFIAIQRDSQLAGRQYGSNFVVAA